MSKKLNKQCVPSIYRFVLVNKLFTACLNLKLLAILVLGISSLVGTKSQAVAQDSILSSVDNNVSSSAEFSENHLAVTELKDLEINYTSKSAELIQKSPNFQTAIAQDNRTINFALQQTETNFKQDLFATNFTTKEKFKNSASRIDSSLIQSNLAETTDSNQAIAQLPTESADPANTQELNNSSIEFSPELSRSKAKDLAQSDDTGDSQRSPSPNKPLLQNPEETPPQEATPTPTPQARPFELDSIVIDSNYKLSNYKIYLFEILPTVQFRFSSGDKVNFRVGYNTINSDRTTAFQPEDATVIPIRVGWEKTFINRLTVQAGATYYNIDPYPDAVGADAAINYVAFPNLFLGFRAERGPMRYAPSTIAQQHKTSSTQYGPNLFWQIDRNTSLFALYSISHFNNDNRSQLSYSKLKRVIGRFPPVGQFHVAANLVTFSYDRETPDAFFSPPDYLIYNGELGWETDITKFLNFRAQFNLGEQRYLGAFTQALYYELQLTAKFSRNADGFIKYSYGNLANSPVYSPGNTVTGPFYREYYWVGQLRFRF